MEEYMWMIWNGGVRRACWKVNMVVYSYIRYKEEVYVFRENMGENKG
jgi:hypothetical protein